MKRVLLVVVDGCTPRVLAPAMTRGELPFLSSLAAAGSLELGCVSIFPSITPAATASIITGRYPNEHGIVGMSWVNTSTGEISYFGDDVRTVLSKGIGEYLRDFLVTLNHDRLTAPTLFQVVERHGRRAACFNYLIFRGDVVHEARPPLLLRALPSVDASLTIRGPSWLCLGSFVSTSGSPSTVGPAGGPFHRFGFDDASTLAFLRAVPEVSALADFSVAYFADYDFDSHEHGPEASLETLHRLDAGLGGIIEGWGGLDRVLHETCIVLTADHAHTEVGAEARSGIALEDVLHGYRCGSAASGWQDDDELMLCPNMRAAEIYLHRNEHRTLTRVTATLLEDARVDQVIWREPQDEQQFVVATADRGTLRFRPGSEDDRILDAYGGRWRVEGELDALDMRIDADGRVQYGAYPNALERILTGVGNPRAGRMWATARPGCEFMMPGQQVHDHGGSHGTLHELDSLVPLIIAGCPATPLDAPPRIIDVAPLCARVLDVPLDLVPGQPRV